MFQAHLCNFYPCIHSVWSLSLCSSSKIQLDVAYKWKLLTCPALQCTDVAPGRRCHCAVPPTNLQRLAGKAAARRLSWRTALERNARHSQTWRWLQWVPPLSTQKIQNRSGASHVANTVFRDRWHFQWQVNTKYYIQEHVDPQVLVGYDAGLCLFVHASTHVQHMMFTGAKPDGYLSCSQ